jgi:hypothetical protein
MNIQALPRRRDEQPVRPPEGGDSPLRAASGRAIAEGMAEQGAVSSSPAADAAMRSPWRSTNSMA